MTDVRERLARFLAAKAIAASDNGERLPDNLWAQKLPLADAILAAFPELTAPDKDMVKGAQEVIGKWMALTPVALDCAQDVAAFATAHAAREKERLEAVIERDRCAVADAMNKIRKTLMAREWLRLGRGSYSWNDDRWRDEFAAAWQEIWDATEALVKIAADKSDSPVTLAAALAAARAMEREADCKAMCGLCEDERPVMEQPNFITKGVTWFHDMGDGNRYRCAAAAIRARKP